MDVQTDPTQRILVVDDDLLLLQLVREVLEHAGFRVLMARTGPEALDLISKQGLPHLAIVDIMLPGMDGFELCRALLERADLPIILLSALHQEETVVEGLERFAEDYITKPFRPSELVARVRRVLRRMGDFGYALEQPLQVDAHLAVDFARQCVVVDGKAVPLTPVENKLLHILVRRAGRTVSTEFLLQRLWPLEEVYEDTLRVHIHRLRRKMEPDPSRPRYILTDRGEGYRFGVPPPGASELDAPAENHADL